MIFRILEDQYGEKLKAAKAVDRRFMQLAGDGRWNDDERRAGSGEPQ